MKIFDGQKGKRCDDAEYLSYTHKRCPKCESVKVVSLFYKKKAANKRGWAWDSECIECRRAATLRTGLPHAASRKRPPPLSQARQRRRPRRVDHPRRREACHHGMQRERR